jgi:hypothetical protein
MPGATTPPTCPAMNRPEELEVCVCAYFLGLTRDYAGLHVTRNGWILKSLPPANASSRSIKTTFKPACNTNSTPAESHAEGRSWKLRRGLAEASRRASAPHAAEAMAISNRRAEEMRVGASVLMFSCCGAASSKAASVCASFVATVLAQ